MFCAQCGEKISNGARFCSKCGASIAPAFAGQNVPPAWTAPPPDSRQENAGGARPAGAVPSADTSRNKLTLAAGIVALALIGIIVITCIITVINYREYGGYYDYSPATGIMTYIPYLVLLIITTILCFAGGKSNSRPMVIVAAVLFFLLCLPSSILCIIAAATMKKRVKGTTHGVLS